MPADPPRHRKQIPGESGPSYFQTRSFAFRGDIGGTLDVEANLAGWFLGRVSTLQLPGFDRGLDPILDAQRRLNPRKPNTAAEPHLDLHLHEVNPTCGAISGAVE